jgi:branched-chain amino acid transport system ATP-binding protein
VSGARLELDWDRQELPRPARRARRLASSVPAGAIHALIGPNGAGKTTLFNLIAGVHAPDEGRIAFDWRAYRRPAGPTRSARRGVGRTFQIVRPFPKTDRARQRRRRRAACAAPRSTRRATPRARSSRGSSLDDQHATSSRRSLTLPDRKRLEVARALATEPKLLLLDEVMAGLRPTEIDVMVTFLQELNKRTGLTILLIEHVMRAVMALASNIVVVSYGEKIAEGAPAEIARHQAVLDVYLGEAEPA